MSEITWEYKRPYGDQIARGYGLTAYNRTKVENIKVGDTFDVLCSDGLNYCAEVKRFQGKLILHYKHWAKNHDYHGPMGDLYLAEEGLFSIVSIKNKYFEIKDEEKRKRHKKWICKALNDNENTSAKYYPERKKPRTEALQIVSPLSTSQNNLTSNNNANNNTKSSILIEKASKFSVSALSPYKADVFQIEEQTHKPERVALNRLPNRSAAADSDIQDEESFDTFSFEDDYFEIFDIDDSRKAVFNTLIPFEDDGREVVEVSSLNNHYIIDCTFRPLIKKNTNLTSGN
jgi:hypothetical protein